MRALDGEGEPMHCGRNTLKFPGFLGILAHAQTVCTRLSFLLPKEPGVEATYCEQDDILDTNIDVDEVEFAIWCLKRNCAEGLDLISSEHLKFTGPVFRNLLCQDIQSYLITCHLEHIPQ